MGREGLHDQVLAVMEAINAEQMKETQEGWMSCCPLPSHDDDTPSFAINAETGLWRCYGCKEGGNLPMLVAAATGITLEQANREWSADALNIRSMPKLIPKLEDRNRDDSEVIPESTVSTYVRKCPRWMISDRGFDKDFLRDFEVGYDPASMSVVFPIRDVRSRLVGVTRRTTIPGVRPKYLHTKFSKGNHLYLGQRMRDVTGAVYLTEGHIDALKLFYLNRVGGSLKECLDASEAPFGAAVAMMGSSLTKTQARLMTRRFTKIVIAFDNDNAGVIAAQKSVEALYTEGALDVYVLDYDCSDPGDLLANSKADVVSFSNL